jgi:exosome complex RNA-binding protein Rrp42 (RNase PH superfamily)
LIDPNADEERLMNGFLAISMNEHKEICGIHMGGTLGLKREQVSSRSLGGMSETVVASSRLISARNLLSKKCWS